MRKFSTIICILLMLSGLLYFTQNKVEAQASKNASLKVGLTNKMVVVTASDRVRDITGKLIHLNDDGYLTLEDLNGKYRAIPIGKVEQIAEQ